MDVRTARDLSAYMLINNFARFLNFKFGENSFEIKINESSEKH